MQLLNDIRNYENLSTRHKIYLTAFLIALSGVLSTIDAMVPKPIPLAKIGIANIVTLVLIIEGKYRLALIVALFRTLVASFMTGSFLSYTFLLSFTGSLGSALFMILFNRYAAAVLSEIGLSVIGAFFNTLFQGLIVVLFFGFDRGTVLLISIFVFISLVNGILIGWLARAFYKGAGKSG
jgi:heptaprenyl diphosphate synthase